MPLFQIFLTYKEIECIIHTLCEAQQKELAKNIKEQIFKRESEIKDWEFTDGYNDRRYTR